MLFDVFGHAGTTRPSCTPIKPTVAEALADPTSLTFQLLAYDPDYPVYGYDEILDARRTCRSWRPCTAGRWCCTTSTRGTARRSA